MYKHSNSYWLQVTGIMHNCYFKVQTESYPSLLSSFLVYIWLALNFYHLHKKKAMVTHSQQHILGFMTDLKNNYCLFLLCLQPFGHNKFYMVAKNINMPHGIMVL
jgi:hypothetical protein